MRVRVGGRLTDRNRYAPDLDRRDGDDHHTAPLEVDHL